MLVSRVKKGSRASFPRQSMQLNSQQPVFSMSTHYRLNRSLASLYSRIGETDEHSEAPGAKDSVGEVERLVEPLVLKIRIQGNCTSKP